MWDKLELNLLHQHGDDKHENEQEHWGAMCHVSKASGLSASVIPLHQVLMHLLPPPTSYPYLLGVPCSFFFTSLSILWTSLIYLTMIPLAI